MRSFLVTYRLSHLLVGFLCSVSFAFGATTGEAFSCIPIDRKAESRLVIWGTEFKLYRPEDVIWHSSDLRAFSAQESKWQTFDLNQWCYIETLGRGQEGVAIRVRHRESTDADRDLVLKAYSAPATAKNQIYNLLKAGKKLEGRNYFTSLHGVLADEEDLQTAMMTLTELNQVTALTRIINVHKRQETLDYQSLTQLLINLLQAMKGMHQRGVLHGDLHDRNVMFDQQGRVKFVDFDDSRIASVDVQATFIGSEELARMYKNSIDGFIWAAWIHESEKAALIRITEWMKDYSADNLMENYLLKMDQTIKDLRTFLPDNGQ